MADEERRYVTVPTTQLYGTELYGKYRGVRLDQGDVCWLRLPLFSSQTGAPLTISAGPYSTPPEVLVRYREATGYKSDIYIPSATDVPALSSDGTAVLLPIPLEVKNAAGVFSVQMLVRDANGLERTRDDFMILMDRGMFLADGSVPTCDGGIPTLQELRTAVRDHPGANRLLAEFDNDVAEYAQSIVAAVQAFNTTLPQGGKNFTTITWPAQWRRQLTDGCMAYVCETLAAYQRRGMLPYQAAGLAVDDLAKEKDYLQASMMYRARFEEWCKRTKIAQSVDSGWGSVSSGLSSHGPAGWW